MRKTMVSWALPALLAVSCMAGCGTMGITRVDVVYYGPPTTVVSSTVPPPGEAQANPAPVPNIPICFALPPGEWTPIGEIQIESEEAWPRVEKIARGEGQGMKADVLVVLSNQALSTTYYTSGSAIEEEPSGFFYGSSQSMALSRKLIVFQALQRKAGEAGKPPAPSR